MARVREGVEGKSYWDMAARACDSCKGSPALLFCRADSAFLCGVCDARIHGANKFASRHGRVWMCQVCEQAPAAVTCKADAATLCVTCDGDIHSANPLARRHERFPVVPFYESPPSATAALHPGKGPGFLLKPSDEEEDGDGGVEPQEADLGSWLLPNPNPTVGGNNDHRKVSVEPPELKAVDFFFSDVEPYLDLDYPSSMDGRYEQADSIVPVQTKAVSATAHPPAFISHGGSIDFDFGRPKPSYGSYSTAPSLSHSISSSDVGVVPDSSAMADVTNPYGGQGGSGAAAGQDREARLMRYREKRKNRKFEKTIRYASRKAYAETRPRIKGRFAKRAEMEAEPIYAAAAALMVDPEYGVVPSF